MVPDKNCIGGFKGGLCRWVESRSVIFKNTLPLVPGKPLESRETLLPGLWADHHAGDLHASCQPFYKTETSAQFERSMGWYCFPNKAGNIFADDYSVIVSVIVEQILEGTYPVQVVGS